MIEKPRHEFRRVERNELVHGALGQALLGERSRRNGAGRDKDDKILRADALDQRYHREHFTDAGAVHPDQRTWRPWKARLATPFAQPRRVLFAALKPAREETRRQRRRAARRGLIDPQHDR